MSSAPTNTKAQLDLGNLLLVAGKYQDARDHAQSVLQIEPQNPNAQLLLADSDAGLGNAPKALDEAQKS